MSTRENDEWVLAAYENFEQAIEGGNYHLAQDIIADTADAGFEGEAQIMRSQLAITPLNKFLMVSPIQRHDL